jgi:alkanesulfonate monooxygenase SsuD/methylene tetrahydromethanopterin reductase-like flavin-dependent oxidoreductase (luciferase family)
MKDLSGTREIWEDVIAEFPKMWMQDEYEGYQGKFWSLPPRKILPKPWKKPHPPMWYACGNVSSYEMAAQKGLGVLGFSVGDLNDMEKVVGAYKKAVVNAEPVGAFVNDNICVTSSCFIKDTHEEAVHAAATSGMNYFQSQVFRYHDTFPHPEFVPYWPEIIPPFEPEVVESLAGIGGLVCGDPDEVLQQVRRWESSGADQLVFGTGPTPVEDTIKMIEDFGKHIIPKIDTDPVHRTSKMRDAAAAKLG